MELVYFPLPRKQCEQGQTAALHNTPHPGMIQPDRRTAPLGHDPTRLARNCFISKGQQPTELPGT